MTDPRCRLGFGLLIAALLAIWAGDGAAATTLRIAVLGEHGQPLPVRTAELLVTAWGDARRIPLSADHGRVVVPLDSEWLQERWPGRFPDVDEAFVFIRAEGGAAIRSAPFQWIGTRADLAGRLVERAEIVFPRHGPVSIARGEQVGFELVLRREQERYLRFVDESDNPVAGVLVRTYLFGSDKNYCGYLAGAEALAEATSDDAGRVRIPDGDFVYAFELLRRLYVPSPYSRPLVCRRWWRVCRRGKRRSGCADWRRHRCGCVSSRPQACGGSNALRGRRELSLRHLLRVSRVNGPERRDPGR